jgi:two-component system phosphate regulon sensor histidine kinase PhoR
MYEEDALIGIIRTSMPVTAIEQTVHEIHTKILLAGLLIAILTTIISLLVSQRITQPLAEIRQGAVRYAQGDLTHKIFIPHSDELGILAETLNQMAAQLAERIDLVTRQRNELEGVLTNMVEAVMVVDQEEQIVRCNKAAGQLFKVNPQAVRHRTIQETIRNVNIQRFVKDTFTAPEPIEAVIKLEYEQEQFLHAHGTLLTGKGDQTTEALFVFHDITRLKQLENMRRDFVANVSHELKTPITSITGFIETLREGAINDPEHAHKFLSIIERNANRLNSIIDDLLTLSKIEQGTEKEQIVLTRRRLRDVLESAMVVCQQQAEEHQVTFELHCPAPLQAHLNAPLFEQAVVNLLDNAVKYSPPGSVVRLQAETLNGKIMISIQDQGSGIAAEHLPRIFERFYRVDKARSRKQGGTGLGLAIVKHIANVHHGYAAVESIPGIGSTFSIVVPASVQVKPMIPQGEPSARKSSNPS